MPRLPPAVIAALGLSACVDGCDPADLPLVGGLFRDGGEDEARPTPEVLPCLSAIDTGVRGSPDLPPVGPCLSVPPEVGPCLSPVPQPPPPVRPPCLSVVRPPSPAPNPPVGPCLSEMRIDPPLRKCLSRIEIPDGEQEGRLDGILEPASLGLAPDVLARIRAGTARPPRC
ncbi:MAG: hypothetical protein R3F61_19800 [Myxococcota bacterium]